MTVKSSTIFISVGDKTKIYRSVNDVPPKLRRKLHETTNGINAATILIADRKGREEIVKAIQGLPAAVQGRLAPQLPKMIKPPEPSKLRRMDWRTWVEILLPGAVGVLIWLAFNYK